MSTFVPLRSLASALGKVFFLSVVASGLSGCIADTAEDTDLPWATNKSWEGLAPISPAMMDRYD